MIYNPGLSQTNPEKFKYEHGDSSGWRWSLWSSRKVFVFLFRRPSNPIPSSVDQPLLARMLAVTVSLPMSPLKLTAIPYGASLVQLKPSTCPISLIPMSYTNTSTLRSRLPPVLVVVWWCREHVNVQGSPRGEGGSKWYSPGDVCGLLSSNVPRTLAFYKSHQHRRWLGELNLVVKRTNQDSS